MRCRIIAAIAIWGATAAPALFGCSTPAPAAAREFEPPYRMASESQRLVVRSDLVAHLKSVKAEVSPVVGDVIGFGRLDFAPGASYAVRVPFESYVERVLVGIDDTIKEGQALAELRSSALAQARAELASGRVAVRAEEQTIARLEPLVRDGTVSERDVVEARSRLEAARAQVAGVRAALRAANAAAGEGDRFVLRASASGRVLARHISPGERLSPDGDPAFLIGDPERLVVSAAFPERDAVVLREGASCRFSVHAIAGQEFRGRVTRIVRSVDPQTRSTVASCEPESHDARFSAQMVARVSVDVEGDEQLVIPRAALLLERDEHVVLVRATDTELERRVVVTGLQLGERVQLLEGVRPGEEVVVAGAVLLNGEFDTFL